MRTLKFLLIFGLISNLSFGEASRDYSPVREYIIASFDKGLNSQLIPYLITDNQASEVRDTRFNQPYGAVSKRERNLSYGDAIGAFNVTGLHRYYTSTGIQQLIATGSTKLFVGNDTTGAWQTLKGGLSDGKRWQFVNYMNTAILTNGYNAMLKYDGKIQVTANTDASRTAENLCAELGAPFAEQNTGSNLTASRWYQYKIAYYDGSNYSYVTNRSNSLLTGSTVRDVTLTDIPLAPSGTTHRYIYRTLGNTTQAAAEADNTFYMVADIANNIATTYNDAMSDATASGDAAPTWATVAGGIDVTPPKGAYVVIHSEKLFVGGDPLSASYLYWSDEFNPDIFQPENYEPIREDDGDEITFLKVQLGILTVGKTTTIQKFYTDADPYYASAPFSFKGCPAPYSVAATPMGIIYLGRDGLYRFDGQQSSLISDIVTPQIQDISSLNSDNACGMFFKNQYLLAYTSDSSGETMNNRVLIYDLTRDSYTLDYRKINTMTVLDSGTDLGSLCTGSSNADGKVYLEGFSTNLLNLKTKTDLDAGTFVATATSGTELSPILNIAWDIVIDSAVGTIDTGYPGAIIDRQLTAGTWTSAVYKIDSSVLNRLYWNESLEGTGEVLFQIRTGPTAVPDGSWTAWSATFTDPNGSDVSGVTANDHLQFKVSLSTTDITLSPYLFFSDGFVIRLTYAKAGLSYEPSFVSSWTSGWRDFAIPSYPKYLNRIEVYYKGEANGQVTISYENSEGDFSDNFTIDLTQATFPYDMDSDNINEYTSRGSDKCYVHYAIANDLGSTPKGVNWKFKITDTSSCTTWEIDKIIVKYTIQEDVR